MSLGKRIKNLRLEKGLMQKELAYLASIPQKSLSTYENDIAIPAANILKKLADALHTSADYLLGGSPFPELNNPEFVKVLNEIDQLPKKEKEALLTTLSTFLGAYKKGKKSK